ncbi:Transmembrane protein 18 [Merluccius polli]|uniref:Transmembrane protein 18 n=1 Tax=Merluccius polli TaxID=89951 RepID=A0AA47MIT8_MERPO|nr:Transmembrane protein 18 [Merluccius polli]
MTHQKLQNASSVPIDGFSNVRITSIWTFLMSVQWSEPWLIGLLTFQAICFGLTLLTCRFYRLQICQFLVMVAMVYSAEYLNELAAMNWRLQKELTTGPQTLIVGDGAVIKTKHFFSKNTKVLCFTNDMVSDISEKILEITAEHPTVKSLVIHTGALDVVKQQSEVLKQDFNDLPNKVRCLNTEVFISGPLPTVRRGDERFSRLLMLNRWLKDTCAAQSVNFIDNFNIFWERRHLFEADGFCLNKSFSNFQYFDSTGMFISLVYSIPLVFNTIIIVIVWVYRTFSTMTELKTLQLKRKAQREGRKKTQ